MRQSMLTNARLFQQSYQHPKSITAAISQAKLVCEKNNVRLTSAREEILKIVWLSHQPLGAYQIQDELSKLLSKKIAPPTVYRALAFLIDNDLVHPPLYAALLIPLARPCNTHNAPENQHRISCVLCSKEDK